MNGFLGNHDAKPGLGHSSCEKRIGPYFELFSHNVSRLAVRNREIRSKIPSISLPYIDKEEGSLYYSVDVHEQVHVIAIDSNVGVRYKHFYHWLQEDIR